MSEQTEHVDPGLLLRYEDGDLDSQQRSAIEAHVEGCGVCRAELALAREVASRAVGATLGAHSDVLTKSLQSRLDARLGPPSARPVSRARRRPSRWLSRGLLAASVAIIALGVAQLRKPSPLSDLGRTTRSSPAEALAVELERVGDAWRVHVSGDEVLRDRRILVTTAGGEVALERVMTGDEWSFTRADLGRFGAAATLFVQVVATDAVGNPLRSRPERLP